MTLGRIVDVSSNNHPGNVPIDWTAVAGAGFSAAVVKATEGTNYTNPFYTVDVDGAQAAGLEVIAYHFCTFGNAAAEAAHFLSVAGELAKVADIETSSDVVWTNQFLANLGLDDQTGCTYGSASNLSPIWQHFHSQIWVAAYRGPYPGFGEMWQWTSSASVPGITGDVDENQWMGSLAQYDSLFGVMTPVDTQEVPMWGYTYTENGIEYAVTMAVGAGNSDGHLLQFTRQVGQQTNDVRDITVQIGLTANNGGPFLVQG